MTSTTHAYMTKLPADTVERLVSIIRSELPHKRHSIEWLEVQAFAESRTVHDGQRLARALRNYMGRPGLAQEIEDAISEVAGAGA